MKLGILIIVTSKQSKVSMKARLGLLLTTILSCFILYSCMSQEQQEQVLQNSEPQSVDVTVNVGGDSRAERFLGTFDQISRLSLDIDRNYGNKRVLTDFPLEHDGSKWTGTINKLIVGFDYTITGHAYKCTDCSEEKCWNLGTGIQKELFVSNHFPIAR